MNITVLVDNNTYIDKYFLAEPGLSLLVQDDETTVLFDTGYSDIFIKNAYDMGKDLTSLDYVVLSHNHLDHTWGLDPLIKFFSELQLNGRPFQRPALVAHPEVFVSVSDEGYSEVGSLLSKRKTAKHFPLQLSAKPVQLSSRLTFLGEIPRQNDFENILTFGKKEGSDRPDHVPDDSAIVYRSEKGLIIITGCSHAGICNITEYAREVCADNRVAAIIGGFHLQNPPSRQLEGTISYLSELRPDVVYPCHCTDLASKVALSRAIPVKEVGVGLSLSYDLPG